MAKRKFNAGKTKPTSHPTLKKDSTGSTASADTKLPKKEAKSYPRVASRKKSTHAALVRQRSSARRLSRPSLTAARRESSGSGLSLENSSINIVPVHRTNQTANLRNTVRHQDEQARGVGESGVEEPSTSGSSIYRRSGTVMDPLTDSEASSNSIPPRETQDKYDLRRELMGKESRPMSPIGETASKTTRPENMAERQLYIDSKKEAKSAKKIRKSSKSKIGRPSGTSLTSTSRSSMKTQSNSSTSKISSISNMVATSRIEAGFKVWDLGETKD